MTVPAPVRVPAGAPTPVAAAVSAMAAAVQSGDFAGAEAAGAAAEVHLAFPKHALLNLRPLSEGAQATVLAAQLAQGCAHLVPGLAPAPDGSLQVAVKRAHIRDSADLQRFRREAVLLAQLRHPHIVRLLGARLLPPGYQLVLQLEATNAASELHSAGWRPAWPRLLALAAQLAAAVAHMHACGYVHRDIKPANVLLDGQRRHARLADLGLAEATAALAAGGVSHAKPTGGFHKQRMVGTLEYMAPEVLLSSAHSPASDVFALAITLNELATGTVPYSDCTRDNPLAHTILEMGYGRQELAAAVAAEGLRPFKRGDAPPALDALLEACWARQPGARPAAAQVAAALAALAAEAAAACVDAEEAVAAPGGCASPAAAPSAAPAFQVPTPVKLPPAARLMPDSRTAMAPAGSHADMSESEDGPAAAPSGLPTWLAAGAGGAGCGRAAAAPQVFAGTYMTAGKRDRMEDTVVVLQDAFAAAGAPGCTALGVFDGHRGGAASEYLAASLQQLLSARLPGSSGSGGLLATALADADAAFRGQQDAEWADRLARMGAAAAGPQPAPGSTATALLLYPGWPEAAAQEQEGGPSRGPPQQMLAVANLGDSRVVLCRAGQAIQLTRDHTADLPDERQRVAASGGACSVRAGGWRVGTAGLQVTRSIGDADLKGQGVSAEAEVAELALTGQDTFLIAATDGLWDRVSNQDAVALVQDTVKHPGMCAQRLVVEALARGSGDNIAAVVAFLNSDGSTVERVYNHGQLKYSSATAAAARRRAAATAAPSADELRDTY